jgi:hypothetical protein
MPRFDIMCGRERSGLAGENVTATKHGFEDPREGHAEVGVEVPAGPELGRRDARRAAVRALGIVVLPPGLESLLQVLEAEEPL